MEKENGRSMQVRRKRQMLLWLPAIVVPILAFGFHGLGGGKGLVAGQGRPVQQGLNMTLPLAQFDKKSRPADKLGSYQKADADSAKYKERLKQDPYATRTPGATPTPASVMPPGFERHDDQAAAVQERIAALRDLLQKQQANGTAFAPPRENDTTNAKRDPARMRTVVDGLQARRGGGSDPELDRIERLLDKLNRVEHPGEIVDTASKPTGAPALAIERPQVEKAIGSLEGNREAPGGFIEISESDEPDTGRELALQAVVDGEQTITAGSTVAIRLSEEAQIGGHRLPRNQLLYGKTSLSGERLLITINSVRAGASILPVALEVYDLDGLPGIRSPGAITREVSKQSAQEAVTGLQLTSIDQTLSAQAAGAGIQFAKSLAGRKLKLVRISLPSGYRVLLKNVKSINEKR